MKTVKLGKTGLKVSRIGMGGIPIQRPTEEEALKVVEHALDLGVTFIDTALGYGTSEERIGKAIHGQRDEVIIATKTWARDKATALEQLELSLKRLNTDFIDIWQFHNISTFETYQQVTGPGGAMEAAQEALKNGSIRHIGVSSHALNVALKAVSSGQFEMILFPFNFVNNEAADELLQLARKYDIGFAAMKPFAGGRLTDARLVIKYLLQFSNVVPVPGIERAEEIEEIVDIVNEESTLTVEDLKRIEDIRAELGTRFCQWCGYCMPSCPQGIYIPGLINIHVTWKLWPHSTWFSRHAETVKGGKNCIQCGECEEKCPYHLPIREMIVKSIEFYENRAKE
ncbi:MAG: aldo/keto reductase [Theionarchaea archaeon]|nr:aldo/keto reductase [Theionarchaea archaeon]